MENSSKIYIGKGNQVNDYDMFNVSIDITDATPFFFEFQGKTYLRFTLTKMRNKDLKGREFTAYVQPRVKSLNEITRETNEKAAKKKARKSSKKQEPQLEGLEDKPSFLNH